MEQVSFRTGVVRSSGDVSEGVSLPDYQSSSSGSLLGCRSSSAAWLIPHPEDEHTKKAEGGFKKRPEEDLSITSKPQIRLNEMNLVNREVKLQEFGGFIIPSRPKTNFTTLTTFNSDSVV